MRVNLIKQQIVMNYAHKHAESLSSCKRFIHTIKAADWDKPEDMKKTFGSNNVDHLKGTQKIVINIGGNNHRFICKYRFGKK